MAVHSLWGVTSYFNPAGYRRKLANYRLFRERITVPLLTVEFHPKGAFELNASDADLLIQLRDGDVMWQKERLLNAGVERLPADCDYVAWLDCDLVFERPDWPSAAIDVLRHAALCQLFRTIHYLRPDVSLDAREPSSISASYESVGHRASTGAKLSVAPSTRQAPNPYRRGGAWCARRELIAAHGFYDGHILGAGDNLLLFAATGQAEEYIGRGDLPPALAAHYRTWASRFHRDADGIGYTEGGVYHLWHGSLEKRRYFERGEILRSENFDPTRDIARSADGCWRWRSDKPDLHRRVREYFASLDEDGAEPLRT